MDWEASEEARIMLSSNSLDIKQGFLSFENPNYSLADALNRNTPSTQETNGVLEGALHALDSLYSSVEDDGSSGVLTRSSSACRRRYAELDVESMGVDVTTGPVTNLDRADHENNLLVDAMGRKSTSFALTQLDLIEHVAQREAQQQQQPVSNKRDSSPGKDMKTPVAEDSDAAMEGPPEESPPDSEVNENREMYGGEPVKNSSMAVDWTTQDEKVDPSTDDGLPRGWEKHEDNDGPYYWHIKTGTITRTPPSAEQDVSSPFRVERRHKEPEQSLTRSSTSSGLSELCEVRPRSAALSSAYKRRSYPVRSDLSEAGDGRAIRFAVRSLGWVEMAEEDLTPERSSKAVNRCIVDLSVGRRDVLDVVGCWGDGKDLFMDLDEGSLKLVDPENLTTLNTQPIHTIRVWGVGRDNGRERDFAYVARDRVSRKHMCHVFRCDTPARTIANTLRDICKKIMIERSLQQKPLESASAASPASNGRLARPTNLPTEHRRLYRQAPPYQSFPTPMEEPKKVLRAQYVGEMQVDKATGMEVLNVAIDTLVSRNPRPWREVSVSVAPSTITISGLSEGEQVAECRVRFLSFLGIGTDVRSCAFIMHTAQDQFVAHVFYAEPSSGALCKTIEAACKLRYQKCLDAHPNSVARKQGGAEAPKSISATLRSVFTSITGRKARSAES